MHDPNYKPQNSMRNVNTNSDLLDRLHDDDLRQLINSLDRVRVGLVNLNAAPVLDNEPGLQSDLWNYVRVIRAAADLLFRLREESHHA